MGVRLVLGWGISPWMLADHVGETAGRCVVVTGDEDVGSTLREEGIKVVAGDPADPAVLAELPRPDAILVGERSTDRNLRIARAARRTFPDVRLITYDGTGGTDDDRAQLAETADRVVEHVDRVGHRFVDVATSATAVRSHRVRRLLDSIEGRLCIVMHDNPDPDALASAVALKYIAETRGVNASAYYYGEITHQSNRAFVNLLDLPVEGLTPADPLPECEAFALVDHALPGVNDSLPPGLRPDLIFDHHTPSGPVEAQYVDLRESVGATSSIMVEYLRQLEIDVDEMLATALLNGIRTDTKDFTRQVAEPDFDAAGFLWRRADHDALERIENPSLSRDTLGTIGEAIARREVRGPALASCVGNIATPDALSQAADLLLQMDGIDVLIVYGIDEGTVHASARARPTRAGIDLAALMRDAFSPIGTAGGHEEMAGAQIPVGMLGAVNPDDSDDLVAIVREVIDERFFETVRDRIGSME